MRSGDLKQRIEIQAPSRSQNAILEWVDTWNTIATVWAYIEPLRGTKYFLSKQFESEVTGIVHIRYRRNMQPTYRLKYGTRIFKIVTIVNVAEKNEQLDIYYKEELD